MQLAPFLPFFFSFSLSLSLPILFNNILDDAPVRSAGRFAYIPAAKQPIDSTLEDGQTIDPSLSLPLSRSLWLANRSKPLYGLKKTKWKKIERDGIKKTLEKSDGWEKNFLFNVF